MKKKSLVIVLILTVLAMTVSAFAPVKGGRALSDADLKFFSALMQSVLLAVLPVAAGAAVNWLLKAAKVEAGKLDTQTLQTLTWLASIAVKAAEQSNMNGWLDDKKAYAVEICQGWLKARGISLDVATIEAAIEAAVMEEFNKNKNAVTAK
jgi:hypothetical protein